MRSRQTSRINNRFGLLIGLLVLALLSWRFFPTPGQWLGDTLIRPVLFGESTVFKAVGGRAGDLLDDESAELAYLRAENVSLRELMGSDQENRIAAGVIGRPTALPYDVIMIDKGSDDGVGVDTPVYSGAHTVIGFIVAAYPNSALVALISTPGFTSTVYVYGPNIYTTAVGQGGGVTRIHVPQGVPLSTGDVVIIPSLSSGIYGTISAIDSVPERPEQYGYVVSQLSINSLRTVSVGTTPLSVIDFAAARDVVGNAKRDFLMVDVPAGVLVDVDVGTSTTATTTDEAATEGATTSPET